MLKEKPLLVLKEKNPLLVLKEKKPLPVVKEDLEVQLKLVLLLTEMMPLSLHV